MFHVQLRRCYGDCCCVNSAAEFRPRTKGVVNVVQLVNQTRRVGRRMNDCLSTASLFLLFRMSSAVTLTLIGSRRMRATRHVRHSVGEPVTTSLL
jgi:hypothetical protein